MEFEEFIANDIDLNETCKNLITRGVATRKQILKISREQGVSYLTVPGEKMYPLEIVSRAIVSGALYSVVGYLGLKCLSNPLDLPEYVNLSAGALTSLLLLTRKFGVTHMTTWDKGYIGKSTGQVRYDVPEETGIQNFTSCKYRMYKKLEDKLKE